LNNSQLEIITSIQTTPFFDEKRKRDKKMKYHTRKTILDEADKKTQKYFRHKIDAFYQEHIKSVLKKYPDMEADNILGLKALSNAEKNWVKNNRPFFNLNQNVLDDFLHINLLLPWSSFKMTHNPILINLPVGNGIETIWEGEIYEAKSILVYKDETFFNIITFIGNENYTCLRPFMSMSYNSELKKYDTIEDRINFLYKKEKIEFLKNNSLATNEFGEVIFRIAFATVLFAVNAHILPCCGNLQEVFNKYAIKNKRRSNFAQKRKEESEINPDFHSLELFNQYVSSITLDGKSRTELKFQHIRTGHWKKVRYGKGKTEIKEVFIEETIVRPDLPKKDFFSLTR